MYDMFKSRGWSHNLPAILQNTKYSQNTIGSQKLMIKLRDEVFAGYYSNGSKTCVVYYSGHMTSSGEMYLYDKGH